MTSSDQILDWFYLNLWHLDVENYFLINNSWPASLSVSQAGDRRHPVSACSRTTHRNIADPTELTGIFS